MITSGTTPQSPLHLRVFMAAPGDVAEERDIALRVLEELQSDPSLRGKITLEPVSWDMLVAGMLMQDSMSQLETPQLETVKKSLPISAQCDIVVVIIWSRMDSLLPAEWSTSKGEGYLTGTAWEFLQALDAADRHGKPKLLLYRRTEKLLIDPKDPDFEEKSRQYQLVEEFFAEMRNSHGSSRGVVKEYATPTQFKDYLTIDLRQQISDLAPELLAGERKTDRVVSPSPDLTTAKTPGQEEVHRGSDRANVLAERVPTHADDPASIDELGRRSFAEVIGARIDEIWYSQAEKRKLIKAAKSDWTQDPPVGAFMVHIHGPWGIGKTSVLNFLRTYLQDDNRSSAKRPAKRWVVVKFNAWQQQRIRPPWWTLIKAIYDQAVRQLGFFRTIHPRVLWLGWQVRANWFPPLLALALILAAVLLTTGVIDFAPDQLATSNPSVSGRGPDKQTKAVELGLKDLIAVFAAVGAIVAFSRSLVFGSARAAQTYTELRSDPLNPIAQLFNKLVKAIQSPVVVFVDDLDRCESKYVIELLEGIQTLFRTALMAYVVVADRQWICSSFEKGYEEFGKTIGEPGRPLGYLFLDKIFQVSTSVPRLLPQVQRTYWKALLSAARADDPEALEKTRKQAEREATETVSDSYTQEELEAKISKAGDDPVREQAMRAAAAKQITSTEALRKTENRLQRFVDLLEPNPRSMKRMVNAYGLYQARHILEGRSVSLDALARWTIIELRWPLLANLLAARPQFIADLANSKAPDDNSIPDDLKELFGNDFVKRVVVDDGARGIMALDEAAIRQIVGLVPTAVSS